MSINSTLQPFETWLGQFINYEKKTSKPLFALDTIRTLASLLDNPQDSFNSIHVAGSKGKGSVSEIIASIIHEAGYNEGLYTSPHVVDFSERVGRAHGPFLPENYTKSSKTLMELIENTGKDRFSGNLPTWFELVTAFSFLCFKNAGIEWGVFETGMGGRLDATNILLPRLCVLTPIEREHTEILGNTVVEIAGEKAGIIKSGIPVCSAKQTEEAKNVIQNCANEKKSEVYFIEDCIRDLSWHIERDHMSINMDFGSFTEKNSSKPLFKRPISARMKLFGRVQAENAALAVLSFKMLFPEVNEAIIERGLESSKLSGRFDISHWLYDNTYSFRLILDAAHTKKSIQNTVETAEIVCENKPIHLLFACAADKEIEEMAPQFFLSKLNIVNITLTIPGEQKKSDFSRLTAAFKNLNINCEINADPDYKKMIYSALVCAAQKKATLLVTGSFYLLDETLKILNADFFKKVAAPIL